LVNQGRTFSSGSLIKLWALMAIIFAVSFSMGIFSSLVTQEFKTIDTFQEMIDSNLTIMSGNNSFVYWGIANPENDKKFLQLKPKIKFFQDSQNHVSRANQNIIVKHILKNFWNIGSNGKSFSANFSTKTYFYQR